MSLVVGARDRKQVVSVVSVHGDHVVETHEVRGLETARLAAQVVAPPLGGCACSRVGRLPDVPSSRAGAVDRDRFGHALTLE